MHVNIQFPRPVCWKDFYFLPLNSLVTVVGYFDVVSFLLVIFVLKRCSVQFSHSVVSNCLWPHELQHASLPCPSPTPGACSNSGPSSWWYHPTISSYAVSFSSCLKYFSASRSFPMSQSFTSGGQSIGVSASASVLTVNIQDWFPLGLTGLISL